jgi:Secretion system C-terminal sorting domain
MFHYPVESDDILFLTHLVESSQPFVVKKDKLTILSASKDEFKIIDLLGRVIIRGIFYEHQTEVNVSVIPSGMYLLQTKDAVVKFLKE